MKDGETKITTIFALVLVASVCLGMFFLGRRSVHVPEPGEVQHDTTYVPVPYPVHDTLKVPVPAKETPPDTVYVPVPEPTDTAALFAVWLDYYTTRDYDLDFSNDTLGVFKVAAKVNQNKITQAVSTVQPNVKVVTTTQTVKDVKFLQPWIMVSSGINNDFQQIHLGVDVNNKWMLGVSGFYYGEQNLGATVNIGYKF